MQGKNGAGSEGENGNIMLLLDAAQELHRSSSGDEGADIEPSTAGTGAPALPCQPGSTPCMLHTADARAAAFC